MFVALKTGDQIRLGYSPIRAVEATADTFAVVKLTVPPRVLGLFRTVTVTKPAFSGTAYAVLLMEKTGGPGGAKVTARRTGTDVTVMLAPPDTTVAMARIRLVVSGALLQINEY